MQTKTSFDYQKSVLEIFSISEIGLLILDENSQIIWLNGQLEQWLGQSLEQLSQQNWLAMAIEPVDNSEELYAVVSKQTTGSLILQHWKALLPSNPKQTCHFFKIVDSTKQENMSNKLMANLPKRPNWIQFLDYEVSRSRRYDNPLAVLKIKLVCFEALAESSLENQLNQVLAEILKDELRWADMIGESQSGEFLLVLPETSNDSAAALKEKIRRAVERRIERQFSSITYELIFGEANWQKGDSSNLLLERVRDDLIGKMQSLMAKYSELQ
ncbi:MAG: diguanylate cyclase [Gammaproteobacteria bacterium]|nr:diguanylate cyclase [Gammaproteobacteria bacterium]